MIHRSPVCRMYLDRIVPAQPHPCQLLVGKMLHHLQKPRIRPEKILSEVSSALDEILLILPVADFSQPLYQQSVAVRPNQTVPIRAPNDFDDVPSRAPENGFQLLNDFSVAAHRPIQPLQIDRKSTRLNSSHL